MQASENLHISGPKQVQQGTCTEPITRSPRWRVRATQAGSEARRKVFEGAPQGRAFTPPQCSGGGMRRVSKSFGKAPPLASRFKHVDNGIAQVATAIPS